MTKNEKKTMIEWADFYYSQSIDYDAYNISTRMMFDHQFDGLYLVMKELNMLDEYYDFTEFQGVRNRIKLSRGEEL